MLDVYMSNIVTTKKYAKITSEKIIKRTHSFLWSSIPLQYTDLFPGRYWVWDSLKSKILKISVMMLLSGHMVDHEDIQFMNDDETLLSNRHTIIGFIHLSNDVDMDGN